MSEQHGAGNQGGARSPRETKWHDCPICGDRYHERSMLQCPVCFDTACWNCYPEHGNRGCDCREEYVPLSEDVRLEALTYGCGACSRRFFAEPESEPAHCRGCDDLLCPTCEDVGCCRDALPADAPCSRCEGAGALPERAVCPECLGDAAMCDWCERTGYIDWRECPDCGGHGEEWQDEAPVTVRTKGAA